MQRLIVLRAVSLHKVHELGPVTTFRRVEDEGFFVGRESSASATLREGELALRSDADTTSIEAKTPLNPSNPATVTLQSGSRKFSSPKGQESIRKSR